MQSLEIEGKTIDNAIEKACIEFNVPREKLNIEIITDGSAGLFGFLGSKKAKIKASLMSIDITLDIFSGKQHPVEIVKKVQESPDAPAATNPVSDSGDEDFAIKAKSLLEGILTRMDYACPVVIESTDESVILKIQGDGTGLLIGKRGQNLDAIQYIVNKALRKSSNTMKTVIIDTEAYRKRHEDTLVGLAEKVADKVKKTKKAIILSHLNAHDRRIIHLALETDTSLVTKSRGEGNFRKIVIMPAKKE
jgi:spoIIIJ-associated protein